MRLVGQIHVSVPGTIVQRDPSLWEKLKRTLGSNVDLETDRMRVELEATGVVDQVRRALVRVGVTNALSLVIDDTVIFQDADGKGDDLPDMILALSEHASVFGRGFKELRFAAEHDEAALHLVVETVARTEHRHDEPAAVISIGGRIRALEPHKGESADAYRARVEPLTKDSVGFETARLQFESFVGRLESALRAAIPEAVVEHQKAEARIVRQTDRTPARQPTREVTHPAYDPFIHYYPPSPLVMMAEVMMLSSLMHMMHPPHFINVVTPSGAPLGSVADVAAHPESLDSADAAHGAEQTQGADDGGGGLDETGAGFDDGGGGFDDGGGGFDGGDFGGGFD